MKENYWIGELFRFWVTACGVKGSFVHKCIWLPFIHENDIFCYCIFCPKSSIGRNYCLENMKQGEVRKLFTCIKLSSICIRMPMMGWPVQKVWGLIPLGGSEFFPCPTLTKETSLSKTCLVWLVWERKTLCFLSKFSTWMEWPLYSETEKTVNPRNIYEMLCVPKEKAN